MLNKKNWRMAAVFVLAFFVAVLAVLLLHRESKMCLNIEVVPEEFLADKQQIGVDVREYILFEDEKVAVDYEKNIIYIPNQIDAATTAKDLKGTLSIALNEYELKFLHCEQLDNLQQAVKDNHKFTLLAVSQQGYTTVDVVFTTLPVIRMTTGEYLYTVEGSFEGIDDDREVYAGDWTMWSPYDESMGDFSTKTSKLKYHYRGATSYFSKKKSYRISFLDSNSKKRNVALLGQEDDDWVLNAMVTDGVKIKERICMNLWNEHVKQTDYNYKMAQGEYVEVVVDGDYKGLYMLQRRVDPKYLGLSEKDILFKRTNNMSYDIVEDGYEIKDTPLTKNETYEILNDIFANGNYQLIDAQNLADVNLFMEMGAMNDNVLKNIFFVLKDTGDGYMLRFILWDTDMSFGIVWTPTGFVYNIESALGSAACRPETAPYSKINPEIYDIMAQNWAKLRADVLTDENIQREFDECYDQITSSGAYTREQIERPEPAYGGADTKEAMESYIYQKLAMMDEKYLN